MMNTVDLIFIGVFSILLLISVLSWVIRVYEIYLDNKLELAKIELAKIKKREPR